MATLTYGGETFTVPGTLDGVTHTIAQIVREGGQWYIVPLDDGTEAMLHVGPGTVITVKG